MTDKATWPRHIATRAAVLLLAGLAAGCSSQRDDDYSQLVQYAQQSWAGDETITRQQADAQSRASIGLQIGSAPQIMLVQAPEAGRQQLWISSNHIVLAMRDGRVMRTVGLADDLSDLSPPVGSSLIAPSASMTASTIQILRADYRGDGLFSVSVRCHATPEGRAQISILGRSIETIRVEEHCKAPQLGWRFENTYWVDPKSRLVWRSIQHVSPNMAPLKIEMLRPPQ